MLQLDVHFEYHVCEQSCPDRVSRTIHFLSCCHAFKPQMIIITTARGIEKKSVRSHIVRALKLLICEHEEVTTSIG